MRISDWSSDVCSSDLLEVELLDAGLVRRDGGAFDADAVLLDRIGGIDGDLVVRLVALLDGEIEVDEIDIQIGQDQLFANPLPYDAGHLVAVDLDDRRLHLDLRHRFLMSANRLPALSEIGRASCRERGGQ